MNTTKLLTFYRKGPFDVTAEYADVKTLIPGTPQSLGSYKIDLPIQAETKKIKVKAKLTLHGTFTIENAQMVETEEYEEVSKEKREIVAPAEPEAPTEAPKDEAPKAGEAAPAEGGKKEEPQK